MVTVRRDTESVQPIALIYTALSSSIVASLGMLLVPTISRELDVAVSTAQWTLTINLLVGAVVTPVMGRLSDGPHKKRLLIVSLLIIMAGSALAACAPNFPVFLAGRAMQGLTYGIVPVTIAIARRYLPPERLAGGISSLSVTVATGLGLGYPLTGLLASDFGFRTAFWFAVVFIASAIAVAWWTIPDGPDDQAPRRPFDLRGAGLFGAGLAALLIGISQGPDWGWASVWSVVTIGGALILLTIWVLVSLRTPHAMVNLRVIRRPDVLLANGAAIGLGIAMYMGLSIISLVAQAPESTGFGLAVPVLWAGVVMLPLSVGSFAANRVVRALSRRVSLTTFLPIGASVLTAAAFVMWLAHNHLWELMASQFLFGVGIGTTYAAMPGLIARSVVTEELGSAVSFNQVLRTLGGALGSALSGAVLTAHAVTAGGPPSEAGIRLALAISAAGCAAVCVALIVNLLRGGVREPAEY
jgi:predicted MFS family arabinose efflux permease